MAFSTVPKNSHSGATIVVTDGTGTPLSCTVRHHSNITISGLTPDLRAVVPLTNRGALTGLRLGDREFPTISFQCNLLEFTEASSGTILDMIFADGAFAARVSTTATIGDVVTFDVALTFEGTDFGDGADHTITFQDVHLTADFAEGDPSNTITINGTVYGQITGDLAIAQG